MRKNGQAMIETIVALFLMVVIMEAMIFLNRTSWTQLFMQAKLRGKAGERAMSSTAFAHTPENIRDWSDGADGLPNTADDEPRHSTAAGAVVADLTEHSVANHADWALVSAAERLPASAVRLHLSSGLGTLAPVSLGEDEVELEVPAFLRENVYGKDNVTVRERVAMPLLGGLL